MPHNKLMGRAQGLQRGMVAMPNYLEEPRQWMDTEPVFTYCCVPRGCDRFREDHILLDSPGDSVRVICNNDQCTEGNWMHSDCFQEWEQQVLSFLRSCPRARPWTEKQRLQNLWSKKGYDLAYKACDCKCGKGHLRKDTEYIQNRSAGPGSYLRKAKEAALGVKQLQSNGFSKSVTTPIGYGLKTQNLATGFLNGGQTLNLSHLNGAMRPQLRIRTNSLSSTGSSCSPPSSAGTPPQTPGGTLIKKKFDFFSNTEQAAAGNIFKRRTDYSVFRALPRYQQNPYHIKMEDEGPHGNDETRCFVLTNLSAHEVTQVSCVICNHSLPVFDKYPLIDGTFFLSPQRYNTDLQVLYDHKMLYLNAVCMKCLQPPPGRGLKCVACRTPWFGSAFVIGSMYAYDVFAALPCCAQRLTCNNCRNPILEPGCSFQYFSEYSKPMRCPHCQHEGYHFIKQIDRIYSYN